MKGGCAPIFVATITVLGLASTGLGACTHHAVVVVQPDRALQHNIRTHQALWSPKPVKGPASLGSTSGSKSMHLHVPHIRGFHGLHHRFGGYWSRRMFSGFFGGE